MTADRRQPTAVEIEDLDRALIKAERTVMARLTTPARIQAFLDELTYSPDNYYRCPLRVLRDRTAHCFDGAMFAAAALRRLGHPPRVLDLLPNDRDDDHLLAIFKRDGRWGAVAKSNFTGLRFREPIYRTLRELVMSYFEQYFNLSGEKTLRGYTVPLSLVPYDRLGWMVRDEPLDLISDRLDEIRKVWLITPEAARELSTVSRLLRQAGMLGVNAAGLYKPPAKKP